MEQVFTNNFKYSHVPQDVLTSNQYTLVSAAVDVSGSVGSYKNELEKALQAVYDACKKSPYKDSLLVQQLFFSEIVTESFGFQLIDTVPSPIGTLSTGGYTALYDATQAAVEAVSSYGKILSQQDYTCNAVVFIITDGDDNESSATRSSIKKLIETTRATENLAELKIILIGVNTASCQSYLDDFMRESGLDQFINIANADAKSLAKLARFIADSISSSSQALTSGGPSKLLTF